ncbi:MAG: DUF86 domain-containing protein, partial [Acidobacteria bacterium]|nr:DUF86 domain-containing protein [Acidobacteriota bacterium]
IHEYNDIDPRKVFDSLVAALADIPVYLQRIEAAVARPET